MLDIFSKTLQKTSQNIGAMLGSKADKYSKEELESILIECDIEYELIEELLETMPSYISSQILREALLKVLESSVDSNFDLFNSSQKPSVALIIGVNGAGKTTSIAKLANLALQHNKSAMLAAGDTFRAAAIEQLKAWGERLGVSVIASHHNADSSALAFDSINAASARNIDVLLIDTAGRLHNHTNLNNELLKIVRVSQKALGDKKLHKILVLDGTQGTSAINQALSFSQNIDFSGIIITKLDGTSKGGAIFSIVKRLHLPILYIGMGEGAEDLVSFSAKDYVDSLVESIFESSR